MSPPVVALAGNPNCGKTTLFNLLTGLRQRVGNYPGITVEKKLGTADVGGEPVTLVDVPGTYSLVSRSRDEAIAFEVITGRAGGLDPKLTVLVLDASNLDRNLYLTLQVLELGRPALVALNMVDLAEAQGVRIDARKLEEALGVPVVPIVASTGQGVAELRAAIRAALSRPPSAPLARRWTLDPHGEVALKEISDALPDRSNGVPSSREGEALWLISSLHAAEEAATRRGKDDPVHGRPDLLEAAAHAERHLANGGSKLPAALIEARYNAAREIARFATAEVKPVGPSATDRIDAVLLHRVAGPFVLLAVMFLIFQSIFTWAQPLMDLIDGTFKAIGGGVRDLLPPGPFADLMVEGVVAGVGNVLVFIPQIAILSLFIAILEDSGYLARAAYMTDRMMARAGLHGRAFVPLISGFACAVPAIMATRTIENQKDRLVTILVTPLVSCSARLPVYTLIISALFATHAPVLGFISVGALLMLAMYLLSIFMTVTAAAVLKRTVLKSPTPPLVIELPPYRMPRPRDLARSVWDRAKVFVRDAGTIILACSVVLWALLSYPRNPPLSFDPAAKVAELEASGVEHAAALETADAEAGAERLARSYAGRLGHAIEPLIAPLGFDWKIGIGLVGSFAAREVLVSTLGLVYGIGKDADEASAPLREAIRDAKDPRTGKSVYTPLVGLALMVFFVLACQCMSTLAVVRRETGTWRWPAFMFAYMTLLAWAGAFAVYQGGRMLGFS